MSIRQEISGKLQILFAHLNFCMIKPCHYLRKSFISRRYTGVSRINKGYFFSFQKHLCSLTILFALSKCCNTNYDTGLNYWTKFQRTHLRKRDSILSTQKNKRGVNFKIIECLFLKIFQIPISNKNEMFFHEYWNPGNLSYWDYIFSN